MRELTALTLVLLSTVTHAEEWIVLRKPSDPGQRGTPAILIDSKSIQILGGGIRRARVKFDFSADGRKFEASEPNAVTVMILVNLYDCEKQMRRGESMESHSNDGSVRIHDLSNSSKRDPAPEVSLAKVRYYSLDTSGARS
jgi:hypothetical protein